MSNPRTLRHEQIAGSAAFCVIVVFLLIGCGATPHTSRDVAAASDRGQTDRLLKVDGESIVLGEAVGRTLTRDAFMSRLREFTAKGQWYDAMQWCATYRDLAEQTVTAAGNAPDPAVDLAAMYLDQSAKPGRGGWRALIEARRTDPGRFAQYDRQRKAAWTPARRGQFEALANLEPPSDMASPWLAVEALALRGKSALAMGQPQASGSVFRAAAAKADGWDEHVARRMRLFAALAAQLQNDTGTAMQLREQALQGVVIDQINHPTTLRLAIRTGSKMDPMTTAAPGTPSMRSIRNRLGDILFDRGAPQAALLAWREAETDPGSKPSVNRLRLKQARALVALRQYGAATSMLIGVAQTDLRAEALATLGLVHMQRGQVRQGLTILREAATTTRATEYPQVHADAGLALLATGESDLGLQLLHGARQAFEQQQDWEGVRTTLQNELRHAMHSGDHERSQSLRLELAQVESRLATIPRVRE